MPLYDYVCYKCNRVDEIERPMSEHGQPVHCSECGERMHPFWGKRRAPRTVFRGSGWTGAQKRG